jgi:hypothetical protein
VLVAEHRARARVIGQERALRSAPLLEMFFFVIAEHAFVLHRKLDAFAWGGTAIDEVACKDDPIAGGGTHELEEVESLLEAPVQITYDNRASHDGPRDGGAERT